MLTGSEKKSKNLTTEGEFIAHLMSCLDPSRAGAFNIGRFMEMISSHDWIFEKNDLLEEGGSIVRYKCSKCGRELTSISADSALSPI